MATTPSAAGPRSRAPFSRSPDDRLVAGVCGGLGERLGVDAVVLRLALLPLCLAGGAGLLGYVVLWAVAGEPDARDVRDRPPPASAQQLVAIALVVLGTLLLLRSMGLWFGDGIVWPVAVAALGSAFVWGTDDSAAVFGLRRPTAADGDPSAPGARLDASLGAALVEAGVWRVLAGALLVAAGMVAFLAANQRLSALLDVLFAGAVGLAGIGLLLGPWLARLVRQLGDERRERIRGEERAAVAAHLHDSVLQTLALIQRAADQPARTRALARRQERELRAWLYGGAGVGGGEEPRTLGEAVARMETEVEADFDLRVDSVVVGDRDLAGDPVAAGRVAVLLAAVREAVANTARHAGVDAVDVYLEAGPTELLATVRDRGVGFDPDAVAEDRHGIRHSVRGRMRRAGGSATLTTAPGEGVEWELRLPLDAPPAARQHRPDEEP